jgi:hypothetical protein
VYLELLRPTHPDQRPKAVNRDVARARHKLQQVRFFFSRQVRDNVPEPRNNLFWGRKIGFLRRKMAFFWVFLSEKMAFLRDFEVKMVVFEVGNGDFGCF